MRIPTTLICSLLLLFSARAEARPQAPQEQSSPGAATQSGPRMNTVPRADMTLNYYTPRRAEVNELRSTALRLLGRTYLVIEADGTESGPIENMRVFGPTLVVFETRQEAARLLGTLAELDQAWAQASEPDAVAVAEYQPQHVPIDSLVAALQPFMRQIPNPPDSTGRRDSYRNISYVQQPARIVLRDEPVRIEEMLGVLRRVDVPAPQVMLSCLVLAPAGSIPTMDDELELQHPPAELSAHLGHLVPFDSFDVLSTALMRTSVVAGRPQQLEGQLPTGDEFRMQFEPSGWDGERGLLSLARCDFKCSLGQSFETAAVIAAGEYTVLGASGSPPVFVVLRVTALDG